MQKPRKKVTIFDVADKAGVAISTVSRVLNGSPLVSEETRNRVQSAIDALQFRPSRTARSLAQKEGTSIVAVAVPSFTTRFYNALMKGVKTGLDAWESDMMIYDVGFDDPATHVLDLLKRGHVDGILLAHSAYDSKLESHLRVLRIPVVLIGARSDNFDCFYWDNVSGVRAAIEHLIDKGHKKIAMIAAQSLNVNASVRLNTFRETIQAAGLGFDESLVRVGKTPDFAGYTEEAGYEAMKDLLAESQKFTAVFAASDVQAIGASKAIREAGLRIPEDIAVVGYDNLKLTSFLDLSSVDQAMGQVGHDAADLLGKRVSGKSPDLVHRCVVPKLVVRGSSNYDRQQIG